MKKILIFGGSGYIGIPTVMFVKPGIGSTTIDAVGKAVSHEEAQQQLWKAVTTYKPSPRTPKFINAMYQARWMIENGKLEVDSFWTKGYNRTTEWKQAFEDGVNRPEGYSRGYIKWD